MVDDGPLLIPVWIITGRREHHRRPGVLLTWQRRGTLWWGLVLEHNLRRKTHTTQWYVASTLRPISSPLGLDSWT